MATPIYKSCDQRLRFRQVKDLNQQPLNGGDVAYTLTKRSSGTVLSTGNVPYIVDSDGDYWVTIDKLVTANIISDEWYDFEVTYVDNDGNETTQYLECYGALKR